MQRSLAKAKKCTYIAGPNVPNGLLLGLFNINWEDGGVMQINYLGMGENHAHDLDKIKKLGGTGGTILPSVFIEAAMAAARVDNKCVDLFLEHPRFQPSNVYNIRLSGWAREGAATNMLSRPNMLSRLTHDVAPCLYGIRAARNVNYKRMCKFGCKNVRIHETDIRSRSGLHNLLPGERIFGERLWDLRWHDSKLEWDAEEDILKFMLYEESMDEVIFKLVLYRALAKRLAWEAFRKKVPVKKRVMSFFVQWLKKPMQRVDYWGDFMKTNVTKTQQTQTGKLWEQEFGKDFAEGMNDFGKSWDFTAVKETRSYTNWDRISQAARRIASDFIYYRKAIIKLIRKREIALGEQRSAQLRKAIIKVHNLRFPNRKKLRLLSINALSMDYYTLLRMLSPYDIKKRAGPCPTGIEGGNQPMYIMMIAGWKHTINYAYVFRELAGLSLNKSDLRDIPTNPKLWKLEKPFRITTTLRMDDKAKISEAGGNRIKTGLDLINEWMGRTPKKIYNSNTGRWVKINGKIGKQILAKQSQSPPPRSSPKKKKKSSPRKKKRSSPKKKKKSSPRIVENIVTDRSGSGGNSNTQRRTGPTGRQRRRAPTDNELLQQYDANMQRRSPYQRRSL